jgi:two-component system, chemotaxis family, sensor kinase CheA
VVDSAAADPGTIAIVFEEVFEVAEALGRVPPGPVIRLRDHPDGKNSRATIYRYDRDSLLAALARAARGDTTLQAGAKG